MCCKIPCHLIILVHIQFICLKGYKQIFIHYSLANWKQLEMVHRSLNALTLANSIFSVQQPA